MLLDVISQSVLSATVFLLQFFHRTFWDITNSTAAAVPLLWKSFHFLINLVWHYNQCWILYTILYNLIGYSVSGQTEIRSLIINPGLVSYVFCIETQEHRRKKERIHFGVHKHEYTLLVWVRNGCITLYFSKQKEVKTFPNKHQLNFPTAIICVNIFWKWALQSYKPQW